MEWKKDIHLLWALPLLPLGSLCLSASKRIPSSLIPFSKNVIRKGPFGLSIAPLSSCVGSAVLSYIIKSLGFSPSLFSQTPCRPIRAWRSHTCCRPFMLLMIDDDDWSCACLSVSLAAHSAQIKPALRSSHQPSSSQLIVLDLAEIKTVPHPFCSWMRCLKTQPKKKNWYMTPWEWDCPCNSAAKDTLL